MSAAREAIAELECFGSRCVVLAQGCGRAGSAQDAVALAKETLLGWHARFSRFLPGSELSRVNADPRRTVPVRPLMGRLAQAIVSAGSLTGGLVDGTLLDALEQAGYRGELGASLDLARALAMAPPRRPAGAAAAGGWRELRVNLDAGTLTRPAGVRIDSGGLAKGLFADVLGATLSSHGSFAVNCAGDLLLGGGAGTSRPVRVQSPFDGRTVHTFELAGGGVATSGIGRRSWLDRSGRPAHHLLDPATGRPAFTGIVQVTALAPSALAAEVKAKAALLSGPGRARAWLAQGGVVVYDDGSHEVVQPPPVISLARLSGHARAVPRPGATGAAGAGGDRAA